MTSRWGSVLLALAACAGFAPAQPPPTPQPPEVDGEDAPASPDPFPPEPRVWLAADYLLWKVRAETVPVLVGTIAAAQAEVSRSLPPGTIHPLFGGPNSSIDFGLRSGWRVDGGCRLDPDGRLGLEAGFFQLPRTASRADFRSAGDPVIGPAFQDRTVNQGILIMSSVPGLRTGAVSVTVDQSLWGGEIGARRRLGEGLTPVPLDLVAGFRYLQVDEGLEVAGESAAVPNGRAPCG